MEFKKTMLGASLALKCPRCREGNLFKEKSLYTFKNLTLMHQKCSNCSLLFEPEPSYYTGSMYVSYGLTVGISIAVFVLLYFVFDISMLAYLIINGLVLLILIPYTFRFSRSLWITMFIKFDPNAKVSH